MTIQTLKWTVALALAVSPRLAEAQCRDDRRGGYRSKDEAGRHSMDERPVDRTQEAIDGLLSDAGGRQALVGAILAEAALLEDVIDAIAERPEWRALAREELDAARTEPSLEGPSDRHASPGATGSRSSRVPRKAQRAMRGLLSNERSRDALMDAVLEDAELMRDITSNIAGHPEASALMAERLTDKTARRGVSGPAQRPPAGPSKEDSALYACPMHPEVTSGRAGSCPKCGMTLRRVR